jgi:hypothetical protein
MEILISELWKSDVKTNSYCIVYVRIAQHWSEHYEILSTHTPFIVSFPMISNVWQGAPWFGIAQHGPNQANKLSSFNRY